MATNQVRGLTSFLRRRDGQALAEFALVFPIAMISIFGVISFGLLVFHQQQVTNVAREAARFAAVRSAEAPCPTSSWRDPNPILWGSYTPYPLHCDGPNNPNDTIPWPKMTDHARTYAWAVNRNDVKVNACWSGYKSPSAPPEANADFPPTQDVGGTTQTNVFMQCTIAGLDPTTQSESLGCTDRMTTASDDTASDLPGNLVTVYACLQWKPPLAGVLFVPSTVTIRAVVTETIHQQQGP